MERTRQVVDSKIDGHEQAREKGDKIDGRNEEAWRAQTVWPLRVVSGTTNPHPSVRSASPRSTVAGAPGEAAIERLCPRENSMDHAEA